MSSPNWLTDPEGTLAHHRQRQAELARLRVKAQRALGCLLLALGFVAGVVVITVLVRAAWAWGGAG